MEYTLNQKALQTSLKFLLMGINTLAAIQYGSGGVLSELAAVHLQITLYPQPKGSPMAGIGYRACVWPESDRVFLAR